MKKDPCKTGRHCLVWSAFGQDMHVRRCAHCREMQGLPWFSEPDDDRRAQQSQQAHEDHCVRLLPYADQDPADLAIAKMRRRS